jgi:hypothetical protein
VCFALEAGQPIGMKREEFRQDLERDVAMQCAVVRAVDFAL